MASLPRDRNIDNTLSFMKEGYAFISNRCQRYGTDAFETRIMMQKAICVMGEDAARMFYVPGRFTRKFAIPPMALFLLQDRSSTLLRAGESHRKRKQMFMSLMSPHSIWHLLNLAHTQWQAAIQEWEAETLVILHHEVEKILCKAVCEWDASFLYRQKQNTGHVSLLP